MLIILKRVSIEGELSGIKDYGFVISRRNLAAGREYHKPTKDSSIITERIFQYGYIVPPIEELDNLISIGVKLWMNNPECIQDTLENLVVDALESFTLRFTKAIVNDSRFRVFSNLYFNYSQKDVYVDSLINRAWASIVQEHNARMELRDLPSSSFITDIESEYLKCLVVRLITKGIRYAVFVYRGNVIIANKLFELTHQSLQSSLSKDVYSDLFIAISKKDMKIRVSSELPTSLNRFVKYFIVN